MSDLAELVYLKAIFRGCFQFSWLRVGRQLWYKSRRWLDLDLQQDSYTKVSAPAISKLYQSSQSLNALAWGLGWGSEPFSGNSAGTLWLGWQQWYKPCCWLDPDLQHFLLSVGQSASVLEALL